MSLVTFYPPSTCLFTTDFFSHQGASLVERFLSNRNSSGISYYTKKAAGRPTAFEIYSDSYFSETAFLATSAAVAASGV